ncbi:hypothetical protein PMAYCL1PPCAC_12648, partial [Pristionchus mayeri]
SRCTTWVQGGFCTSNYYTLDYRKATCGSVCNLCPTTAAAACVGTTENVNCASWKTNGFCTNLAYTETMKRQYCCRTCFTPVVTVTSIYRSIDHADCRYYRMARMTPPPLPLQSITRVFVKSGCSLKLYTDPMGTTAASGSP